MGNASVAATPAKVRLALNWFPEAEHGGYYAAQSGGEFKSRGLDVEILPGGPDAPVIQRVALGQVDFGVANADDVLNARAQEAPVVAVFAPLQVNPRCIMVHADSKITGIAELHDLTLALSPRPAFSHYLRKKFPFQGVRFVPYQGSIAAFLADANMAQQAYVFSEPYLARQQGADVKTLLVADIGFNPYASVLIVSEATLRERPEVVRAMAQASREGWRRYIADPEPANALIQRLNPEMDPGALKHGAEALKELVLDASARQAGLGHMTLERWNTLATQMAEAGLLKIETLRTQEAFSTKFLAP